MRNFLKTKTLALVALLYFLIANILGLGEDIIENEHDGFFHFVYEGFITFFTVVAIYIIWKEIYFSQEKIIKLNTSLQKAHKENIKFTNQIKILRNNFLEIINQQFNEWKLTETEKEVALFILKGLSFDEISVARNTKEKTIRQQASMIYKKSNLKGRHELAAYFFEDLL